MSSIPSESGVAPETEAKTLSSAHTFFNKFVVPILLLPASGVGTLLMWTGPTGPGHAPPPPDGLRWLFTALWFAGSAFALWTGVDLKRVRLRGRTLVISNYRAEIAVPVEDLVEITEDRWINIHPVTLRFAKASRFGTTVRFMPTMRLWAHWRPHPVVAELAAAAGLAPAKAEPELAGPCA